MEKSFVKICHIANTDSAVRFLLLNQLKFLQQQNYDVSAVCSNGKFVKDIRDQGIKVKTIEIKRKISPVADLIYIFQLSRYLKKEKFALVHTHTPKPGLLGQIAAKFARVPVVINTIHGFYLNEDLSFLKRKFYIFIEKIAAKCSILIFSQNQEDIQTAIKEGICPITKIKYLGNGINLDKFDINRFPREFIIKKKQELDINEHRKVIGIVARLVQEKGYYDLFQAIKQVKDRCCEYSARSLSLRGALPARNASQAKRSDAGGLRDAAISAGKREDVLLLIIGPAEPGKKDFVDKDIVDKLGIKDNVLFLGERTDIDEMYPLMDIFVLPSRREGFPRSVLEASALARPIIATDIRGNREAIDNGKTGILVPMKDPGKLADAIIDFLKNPNKAKQMGENARRKAIKEFDEREVFSKLHSAYRALI